MKLLLDTHTFLWLDAQPERVSLQAIEACASQDNELYLSVASAWEIQIKVQLWLLPMERCRDMACRLFGEV